MTTRKMVVSANTRTRPERARLRRELNSLALMRVRVAKHLHCCALCALPIEIGDEFRGETQGRRVHESCFRAVNKEIR